MKHPLLKGVSYDKKINSGDFRSFFAAERCEFRKIVEAIGDAKIVMIGEASHGTSEFYTIRAELSKKLIEQKGFQLIAVEGDWPSTQAVNQYVKGYIAEGETAKAI